MVLITKQLKSRVHASDDLSTSDSSGTDDSSADSPSDQLEQVSVEWRRLLGSTDYERAWGITTGSDGSIYIAGEIRGDLDGQTNSAMLMHLLVNITLMEQRK